METRDLPSENGGVIINSWNEWDPLQHVIVGEIVTRNVGAPDPGAVHAFPDAGIAAGEWHPIPEKVYEQAKRQMEGFVRILEARGIWVDRPAVHPMVDQEVCTPDWAQEWTFGCMPPRDILLCLGNEILESTMSARNRWYEYLFYRPLLEEYFREDPDFAWEAAPKPRLSDASYVDDYWGDYHNNWSRQERKVRQRTLQFQLTEKEPLFDAADMFRFGKDVFIQRSAVTNALGMEWLRRHFEPKGIRVHEVAFDGPLPWHFDCVIIPLRPGLMLQNPEFTPLNPEFKELFRANDWEIILTEPPAREEPHPYSFCSTNLAYNVLSLGPNTVCVEAAETHLMDQLDQLGFDVVPIEFHEVSPFGGGLHCATVDIYRLGDCEDYFPIQIGGF
jgi:glycine amidinotransferase